MTPPTFRRQPPPQFIEHAMSDRERAIRAEGGMRLARRALRRAVQDGRRVEMRLQDDLVHARARLDEVRGENAWLRERLVEATRALAGECPWCGVAAGEIHEGRCRRGISP